MVAKFVIWKAANIDQGITIADKGGSRMFSVQTLKGKTCLLENSNDAKLGFRTKSFITKCITESDWPKLGPGYKQLK